MNSRQLLFFILFFGISLSLTAQLPVMDWSVQCGNSSSDKALDVQVDNSGNVYACGYFNNSGTFGSIQLNPGLWSKETFLTKIDSNGTFLWAKTGGGYFDDRALGLVIDPFGDIIITGTYWSNSTFGPYTLNGSADHVFVVKYDANGNEIWARTGGGQGDDHGYDMVCNPQGDIFITGYLSTHYGPAVCNSSFGSLPSITYSDSIAFVARMSSSGTWQWLRTFGGCDEQRDNDIVLDSAGNVYVVGGFYGTKQFETQTLSSTSGSRDIFVIKYDENGNFLWVKTTGSAYDDRANGITIDTDQSLYITGEFRDEVAFGTDTINNHGGPNGRDIFVAKMDTAGNWIWAKRAGSNSGDEAGRAITINEKHNIYVAGNCKGTVHFGNDTTFSTAPDSVQAFLAAIDTTGDWIWALQCGGDNEDRAYGVTADSSCRVFFCGYFDAPNFNYGTQNLTTYGRKDCFVARVNETCFEYETQDTLVPPSPSPGDCVLGFPNVVSPNGDGVNDIALIYNDTCVMYGSLYIYNRWGTLVYYSSKVDEGWPCVDRDGKPVSDGVYYYILDVLKNGPEHEILKGFVQVVR